MSVKPSELEGKLITCVLPKGKAKGLLEALSEKGHTRINFAYVRGFDIHDNTNGKELPDQVEKETVTIVCKDSQEAEEIFDFVYDVADLNRLGGGMMYMTDLSGAMPYILPDTV